MQLILSTEFAVEFDKLKINALIKSAYTLAEMYTRNANKRNRIQCIF